MITCIITDKYLEIKSFADYFKYFNFIICKVAPYFLDSIHIYFVIRCKYKLPSGVR